MSTEDIPYLGSLTRKAAAAQETASKEARPQVVGRDVDKSVPLFDPVVVELNATILLRFLQVGHVRCDLCVTSVGMRGAMELF